MKGQWGWVLIRRLGEEDELVAPLGGWGVTFLRATGLPEASRRRTARGEGTPS